jgi:hypothetical protein
LDNELENLIDGRNAAFIELSDFAGFFAEPHDLSRAPGNIRPGQLQGHSAVVQRGFAGEQHNPEAATTQLAFDHIPSVQARTRCERHELVELRRPRRLRSRLL